MMERNFELEYNSERDRLRISEYGRNVQKLISHAQSIEDREVRQYFVEKVINLMNIMVPSNKSLADNKQKMWNHVFKIANYDLDVDVPDDVIIHETAENVEKHDLSYPSSTYKNRHYGAYIQKMIQKALAMEDEEKKAGYTEAIASYMKLAYQTWNKEHYVNDNVIIQDLENISNGELTFGENFSIENLVSIKQLKKSTKGKPKKKFNNNRKNMKSRSKSNGRR